MAMNLAAVPLSISNPNPNHPPLPHKCGRSSLNRSSIYSSLIRVSSSSSSHQSDGIEEVTTEDDPAAYAGKSAARTRLELLEQLTSSTNPSVDGYVNSSSSSSGKLTIRDQLCELVGDRDDDFSIPLGKKQLKKVSPKFLTVSQKRNIKRQAYLNEVSQRNDSVFFASIGAFVILPPFVILGFAILTGYVQLFP